jgi:hypothetical protein
VKRSWLIFAMLVLPLSSSASGQYVQVIQTCYRDVAKFCGPAQTAGNPLTECIKARFQDFTQPCKAALVRIAAVRETCGADLQQQCPGIRPNGGRVLLCVKRHFAALSERCKEAIGRAAEREAAAH